MSAGRDLNWVVLRNQMGLWNVLAISGGRAVQVDASTIDLPVGSGYKVRVFLAANDTYTVSRVLKRGAKFFDKGSVEGVYCDQVGEVAYRASCYHNGPFGS